MMMKNLFVVCAVVAQAVKVNTTQLYEPIGIPVYDNIPEVIDQGRRVQKTHTEEYLKVRQADNCVFPLDIVLVQDATASFADDYEEMKNNQLKLVVDGITEVHPNSRIGVVSFRDKPIWSLGDATDYCSREELSLIPANFDALYSAYAGLNSIGGADPAENQLGAIFSAIQSPTIGWTPSGTKLVVVITDAWFHYNDDGLNQYGMTDFSGKIGFDSLAAQCLSEYYPTLDQTKDLIVSSGAYLGMLIFDPTWANGLPLRSWTALNEYIGQAGEFLTIADESNANFWANLASIIKTVEEAECGPTTTTTTTAELTTTTTTTTAALTTTTAEVTTATAAETTPGATVTLVGTTETTTANVTCTCPSPDCPVCHHDVIIKLRHRPSRMHLEVDNNIAA